MDLSDRLRLAVDWLLPRWQRLLGLLFDLPFTGTSGHMDSVAVVANVVEVSADKVVLSFQGRG